MTYKTLVDIIYLILSQKRLDPYETKVYDYITGDKCSSSLYLHTIFSERKLEDEYVDIYGERAYISVGYDIERNIIVIKDINE